MNAPASKLTVWVTPEEAAASATIQIDGREIVGTTVEIPPTTTHVTISVSAPGFRTNTMYLELNEGHEIGLGIEVTWGPELRRLETSR